MPAQKTYSTSIQLISAAKWTHFTRAAGPTHSSTTRARGTGGKLCSRRDDWCGLLAGKVTLSLWVGLKSVAFHWYIVCTMQRRLVAIMPRASSQTEACGLVHIVCNPWDKELGHLLLPASNTTRFCACMPCTASCTAFKSENSTEISV